MSNSKNVINHIKKRKNDLIRVLGGKCCICGFNSFVEALEFHHVDPSTKEFGISQSNAATKALESQLKELKKCILICSNCHKGIHAGYLEVPFNWKEFYNNDVANELLKENYDIKYGIKKHCGRCGKIIDKKAVYCVDCYNLVRQRKDLPTREELKYMIKNLPFTQIANKYGVSDNAIRKWCDKYNLPRKKADIKEYSDEEWELI